MFCRDNLEVLRGLNSASVDLIYLDPPFNKGKEFHAPVGSKASGASFSDSQSSIKLDKIKPMLKQIFSHWDFAYENSKVFRVYVKVNPFIVTTLLALASHRFAHVAELAF